MSPADPTPSTAQYHESRDSASTRYFSCRTAIDWSTIHQRLTGPLKLPSDVTLHLFRHGETLRNQLGLVTGASNVPLSRRGRQQANSLGWQLDHDYDLAFSSSLSRSRETLLLALSAGNVVVREIFMDSRLDERSLGILEGEPARTLEPYARGELRFAPVNGDSYETVTLKALSFLLDLFDYVTQNNVRKIAISTHMGPLRILFGILEMDRDPICVLRRKFANASVLRLTWNELSFPPFFH